MSQQFPPDNGQSWNNAQQPYFPQQPDYPSQPSYGQPQQPSYPSQPLPPQNYVQPMPGPQFSPPQTPKKPRRWPWIIAIFVALMIGYGAGAGGHSNTATTGTATTGTAIQSAVTPNVTMPTTVPASSNVHHKLHDVVNAEDTWQVIVTSAKTDPGDGSFNVPKAGNTFLLIDVSLKNSSDKIQNASGLIQFSLRDKDGNKYDETITYGKDPGGKVAPGDPLKGTLPYEVPTGTKSFILNFQAGFVSTTQETWDITV